MTEEKTAQGLASELRHRAETLLDIEPGLAESIDAWLSLLRGSLAEGSLPGRIEHIGLVTRVAEGVATVQGLPDARFNELLRFPGDVYGLVFNLDIEEIGCVLLGDPEDISAGDEVRLTGRVVTVPVGEALLGRVVDALGRPLDGEGAIESERLDPVEKNAPPILARAPVERQLITGVKAIDALIPIGRGQRELLVGDRATGKTSIALDMILSQRGSDVISVYVAIGQKVSTVKRVTQSLVKHGMMSRTVVVLADADDSPGLLFVAPYAATTVAEYFMEKGRDVLVIYDDLTRHARAYREISLLLRRPPGREAYPGDIFFIHSRLLERATHLDRESGGGSLTAIPIAETQAKNISAYIPTNLISITDGQIFLDGDLFNKGVRPAIHAGKSVSRVGGKTQLPAIRSVAKELRLEYAQFAELEIFTRFGATVEEETRRKIERGRRIREVLKQPRLDPLSAGEQVLALLAVDRGYVDAMDVDSLAAYQRTLRETVAPNHRELLEKIEQGAEPEKDDWETLARAVEAAARDFIKPEEIPSGGPAQAPEGEAGRHTSDAAQDEKTEKEKRASAQPQAD